MKNWIEKRKSEPTTYLGIGQLILALGFLFKIDEAEQIAGTVTAAAEPLANADYTTAGALLLSGIVGILMGEKGGK